MGTAKRLDKRAAELRDEAAQWERKAVLALEQSDEDLAREALRLKARALAEAERTQGRVAEQERAAEAMKHQLGRIESQLDDLKARQKTLAAQIREARKEPKSGQVSEKLGGGAFSDLERMADQIDQLDAEVEAHHLLEDPKRADLDARFDALEHERGDDGIEDELAALKAKLDD